MAKAKGSKKKSVKHPISIDHVARIEGKAGIEVSYTGKKVDVVQFNIFEGPRFFESITLGKPINEAVAVYPRICSFCAAAHKVTGVQAAENAIALRPTEQTKKLREILYIGDFIESHALHLFLLALPDFLGYHDAFTLGEEHPDILRAGMALKDIGADIQTILGSRYIHQENVLIGGFGKLPTKKQLETIADRLKGIRNDAEEALENLVSYRNWPEVDAERIHLALKPYDDTYSMLGGTVQSTEGTSFRADAYKMRISESVVPHSFAKHSHFNNEPFMTSALSRFALFGDGLDGRAKELAEMYSAHLDPSNPMSNNFAQAVELIYFVNRAERMSRELASDLKPYERRIKPKIEKAGIGVSMSEAPRGLLAYTLKVDKNGKITAADIITPTAMFLPMLEADLRRLAEALAEQGVKDPETIGSKLETVVRAYDPCVSCSVHIADIQ
ncbi:Ni/Fe hydrogenase subunit alpha [Candidatus Thorarchaeota archaeon]|jgi:sulfhydrogenase subunit alpha|nr:MAG: Ni/Fe hydrogenase subunit alpha [Candidatus Thorarchaeota archaeon]